MCSMAVRKPGTCKSMDSTAPPAKANSRHLTAVDVIIIWLILQGVCVGVEGGLGDHDYEGETPRGSCGTNNLFSLFSELTELVNPNILPVTNASRSVNVTVEFTLLSLVNFDEISGEISVVSALKLHWTDEYFPRWTVSALCGKDSFLIPSSAVWTPQLLLLNPSDNVEDLTNTSSTLRVGHKGMMSWNIVTSIKASCSVDVTNFPFDEQTCLLSIAPWGYNNGEILVEASIGSGYGEFFLPNSVWEMTGLEVESDNDSPWPLMKVLLRFKRRWQYFVVNVLMPTILLGLINPLVFILTPQSGERISFSITCFLSFCVFTSLLSDNMPKSSSPMSHIAFFMMYMMIQSACIMFATILTLRVYHKDGFDAVPGWVQVVVRLARFRYCTEARYTRPASVNPSEDKHNAIPQTDLADRDMCSNPRIVGTRQAVTWRTVGRTVDAVCFIAFTLWFFISSFSVVLALQI